MDSHRNSPVALQNVYHSLQPWSGAVSGERTGGRPAFNI